MRTRRDSISEPTTARLSVYLRLLGVLEAEGTAWVSSRELAARLRATSAAQIRRDLACFGAFGTRGIGYSVRRLRRQIREILGLDRDLVLVVVGAGRLGMAIADFGGIHSGTGRVGALFDVDPAKVGRRTTGGVPIHHLDRLPAIVRRLRAEIAVLCVPPAAAQEVAERAVAAGIRALLNFAPVEVRVPAGVRVSSVDLTREIEGLAFFLGRSRDGARPPPPADVAGRAERGAGGKAGLPPR